MNILGKSQEKVIWESSIYRAHWLNSNIVVCVCVCEPKHLHFGLEEALPSQKLGLYENNISKDFEHNQNNFPSSPNIQVLTFWVNSDFGSSICAQWILIEVCANSLSIGKEEKVWEGWGEVLLHAGPPPAFIFQEKGVSTSRGKGEADGWVVVKEFCLSKRHLHGAQQVKAAVCCLFMSSHFFRISRHSCCSAFPPCFFFLLLLLPARKFSPTPEFSHQWIRPTPPQQTDWH